MRPAGEPYCSQKPLKHVADAGVRIALGTDSGVPGVELGSAVHGELELMLGAGLKPTQPIVAAAGNAAADVGQSDLGTIKGSKLAGLVVVSGDPLQEISDSRKIQLLVKDGEIVMTSEIGS